MKDIYRFKNFRIFVFVLIFLSMLNIPVQAESNVGFSVKANIPANQQDRTKTYFDLKVNPGETQELEITITNELSEAIEVRVDAISASTNANGLIDYRTPNIKDETLIIPFSDIASIEKNILTIGPNQSQNAIITVTMPEDMYDGIILGGIVITKTPTDNSENLDTEEAGFNIQNIFSYVIGVVLNETDTIVTPDFELLQVETGLSNYQTAIIYDIRNKEASIAKNIQIKGTIYADSKKEKILQEFDRDNIEMAPNSVMPLTIIWNDGQIMPGKYYTSIELEYNGEIWVFEDSFQIAEEEAKELNETNVNQPAQVIPTWLIITMVILFILLLLFMIIIIILLKRKKQDDSKNN